MTLINKFIYLILIYVFVTKVGLINNEILFLLSKEVDLALFCDLHFSLQVSQKNFSLQVSQSTIIETT